MGQSPQFLAHVYCGQTVESIKITLAWRWPRSRPHCARWGPSSPQKKVGQSPPMFGPRLLWQNSWMDQDGTWHRGGPRPRPHCARWRPISPSQKRGFSPQFSAHVYYAQTAGWIRMLLGMEVSLDPSNIVLDGDPALPSPKRGCSPQFSAMSIVAKWLDG